MCWMLKLLGNIMVIILRIIIIINKCIVFSTVGYRCKCFIDINVYNYYNIFVRWVI